MNKFALMLVVVAAPSQAGKLDDLSACMWRTMPASTEQYRTAEGLAEVEAFARATSQCEVRGNVNIKALKKAVAAARPAHIGEDSAKPAVFVQPKVQN